MTAQPHFAPAPPPAAMAPVKADVPALSRALREEARLLHLLRGILDRQRQAVGDDDLGAVDASVFDAQRVLLSLNQARTRRRSLLVLASGNETMPLSQLPAILGSAMTPDLHEALDEVLSVAAVVAREMELNRQILAGAVRAGDQVLHAIGRTRKEATYGSGATASAASPSSLILNRQV